MRCFQFENWSGVKREMQISLIGAGYVGLTTAACLADIGHQVLCADSDRAKLERLNAGRLPFLVLHCGNIK